MDYDPESGERVLAESGNLIVVHCYEDASIYFKKTKEKFYIGDFYGDPTCALVGPDEDWVLVGGEHLTLWQGGLTASIAGIHWICGLRLVDSETVDILTDPWTSDSAVWRMTIPDRRLVKVADFPWYREKPYTDDVEW